MTTIRDYIVNNLVLIVINDGAGDQCGKSYKRRCEIARATSKQFRAGCWLSMATAADNWNVKHEGEPATEIELFHAAAEIGAYYARHIAEMEG